jgi:DNA-binding MarR family transcriptional regulator
MKTGANMTDKQALPTEMLLPAAKIVSREIAAAIAPYGLAPAQYAMLNLLGEQGVLRPSVIARRLDIEASTTTNTINRSVRDGFIEREADPHSSKSVTITLSQKGRDILETARDSVAGVEAKALSGLEDDQLEMAQEVLARIIANLK